MTATTVTDRSARAAIPGTGTLLRLIWRRERYRGPIWLAVLTALPAFAAAATAGLYPTAASRTPAADLFNHSPALVALYGRIYEPTSLGALSMIKLGGFGALVVALVSIFTVVRHTRAEEFSGRLDLLAAGAVDRRAPLTAVLLYTLLFHLVLGAGTATGLVVAGLPAAGSLAFGASWAGCGLIFAGVAAVTAQLADSARAVTGAACLLLGAAYVVRGAGDAADSRLVWFSPVGWSQQLRPYAGEQWWPLLPTAAGATLAVAAAYTLLARRDIGSGIWHGRPGPTAAAPQLRSPLALAWRLQRASLTGWLLGFAVLGSLLGSLISEVPTFLNSPEARDMIIRLGGDAAMVDAYLAAMFGIVSLAAAGYGVQAVARLGDEEHTGRAALVLTTTTARSRWLFSHVMIAAAGATVLLGTLGAAAGLVHAVEDGDAVWTGRMAAAALVRLPAVLVVIAAAVLGAGASGDPARAGWAALAVCGLLSEVGPLLRLEQWLLDLSPFEHIPQLPGQETSWPPLIWVTLAAAVITAAGWFAFRSRDLRG